MREHRIEVGGRTLAVLESGADEGRAVFGLHGTPGARVQWPQHVEDARARGIRTVTYDRPGYGESDPAPGRSVADAAADIAAIADALGIDHFAVTGGSGGTPHALACGALLADRVVAVAALANVAPWEAEGLDWLAGMGQDNLDEMSAAEEGEEALRRYLEPARAAMLAAGTEELADTLRSLLGPPDLAILTGEIAEFLHEQVRVGLAPGIEGWLEDDFAFVRPWGFRPEDIRVPVQLWHGTQDQFVSAAHTRWLAARIPGVETRIHEDDAHLSIQFARIAEVHEWLLSHF